MQRKANFGKSSARNHYQTNFHGACIVTESGQEIPITEQMLQKAFNELINVWEKARRTNKPAS